MDENALSTKENASELSWWHQRSDLEKVLLISLGTATVLIVGILLYTSLKPTGMIEPCSTPGCLEVAAQIISNVDSLVDPCDNFFKFTCGKLMDSTHGDVEASLTKAWEAQIKRQFFEIIQEPISDNDHLSIKNQKIMFQACMDEDTIEKQSLSIFNQSLQELNGWPVAVGSTWKDNLFDWTDMMVKLRSKGYTYSMMLDIHVLSKDKLIIYVDGPILPKVEEENKELYKQYMVDTAIAFGAKKRRAEEDMQKVLDFMERLEKVAETNRQYSNESELPTLTLEDIQMYEYEIDWLDLMQGIFGLDIKISKDSHAIIPKPEFLEKFFNLIHATPKRIQANYMMWRVVETVIPFLSKELKEIQENYYYLSKMELPWKDRSELCLEVLAETFIFLPSVITYARKYLPDEKRQEAQELFTSIKSEFVELIEGVSWIDEESTDKTLKKMDEMTEVIGTKGDYFDDAIFTAQFNNTLTNLEGYPFFRMYLNSNKAQNSNLKVYDHNLLLYHSSLYLPWSNTLLFPVVMLDSFHPDRPKFENYGTIGFAMGKVLTDEFSESSDDQYSENDGIWTNQTRKGFKEKETCINNAIKRFDTDKDNATVEPNKKTIAEITGIKVSYAAYTKWVDTNGEELDLVGIDYSSNQLFWISAMLHRCSRFTASDLQEVFDNYERKAYKTTEFARNNPDFADDFNCALNSPMNPSEKCQVF